MESHQGKDVAEKAVENMEGKKTQNEERERKERRRKERNSELGTERYTSAKRQEGKTWKMGGDGELTSGRDGKISEE